MRNPASFTFPAFGAVAAAIVGFGASLTGLVDDLSGATVFCAEAGWGCDLVRSSPWARPLEIPMSLLGVLFFGVATALAFVSAERLRRWLAIAGGAWAIWLIALQALVIGAWCKLCLIADVAAIAHTGFVLAGARTLPATPRRVIALLPAVAAVAAVIGLWTHTPAPAVPDRTPDSVAKAQVPGVVTVVEFVDFQCPFCREMQQRLDRAIAQTKTPVRIVRRMVPLPQHAGAWPAALAYCCAEAQGRGEDMAKALFEALPEELTAEGCEAIAARVGCDLERYRADLAAAKERVPACCETAGGEGGLAVEFGRESHGRAIRFGRAGFHGS